MWDEHGTKPEAIGWILAEIIFATATKDWSRDAAIAELIEKEVRANKADCGWFKTLDDWQKEAPKGSATARVLNGKIDQIKRACPQLKLSGLF